MNRVVDKIKNQLDRYVDESEISGASILIRKDGENIYQTYCGYANIETLQTLNERTIFRLASMTKPITAIATMILVEKGHLSLDSSISEFLPDYEAKKMVFIRDILNHSSGLGHAPVSLEYYPDCSDSKDTLADRISRWIGLPFDFQPGTETGYSSLVAFDILGRIIEIVSGTDLQDYFLKNIFEPLGIKDIAFILSAEQQSRLVPLYESTNGVLYDVTASELLFLKVNPMINGYLSASAGLFGTLEDYDKIVQLLANGGTYKDVRLLKEETVYQMRTESSRHNKECFPGTVWGLGMIVIQDPERTEMQLTQGTYGWSGAYGTHFFIDVKKKIQVILMLNRSNIGGAGSYISREIEKLVYEIYG